MSFKGGKQKETKQPTNKYSRKQKSMSLILIESRTTAMHKTKPAKRITDKAEQQVTSSDRLWLMTNITRTLIHSKLQVTEAFGCVLYMWLQNQMKNHTHVHCHDYNELLFIKYLGKKLMWKQESCKQLKEKCLYMCASVWIYTHYMHLCMHIHTHKHTHTEYRGVI